MPGRMSSRGAGAVALHIPTKKRYGGPFTTGVPCNPETSVGLQAALVAPASAHLHVAEPIRSRARSITLRAVTTVLCGSGCTCNTPDCVTASHFRVVDDVLCKLCDCRLDDRVIYMYMSMGFCTEECRNEYFLDYKYRLAMAMEAEGRRARCEAEARKPVSTAEGEANGGYGCIFFITSAEVESFP